MGRLILHGRLPHSRFQSRRIGSVKKVKLLCQQELVTEFGESPQNRIVVFFDNSGTFYQIPWT